MKDDGVSRRDFLKSAGAAIAGAAVPAASPAAATPAVASAQGPVTIVLDVNGEKREVSIEPQTTLAEALRGPLELTGTKIGCDRGSCGACTVWINGVPVLSCTELAIEVGARPVTTIEGLARGGELHAVQEAFIRHDALQCGFCTPGLVMSCAALLANNPDPSPDDVRAAIAGHVCRCGAYSHVVDATLDAARMLKGRT